MSGNELKQFILSKLEPDLTAVEKALADNLSPYYELTKKIAEHILFSGGKRLRPLLTILTARLCDYNKEDIYRVSVAFEYLHTATLLHDDIVDSGEKRRGTKTAHTIWNNSTVILVGDFLLARALSIIAATNLPELTKILADITLDMSLGEIMQLDQIGNLEITEDDYFNIIYRKTAVLMIGAAKTGGIMAGESEPKINALGEFAKNLGMAFQMADDLLDYTSDSKILGKNVGADIREGKITLPLIYTLKKANYSEKSFIKTIIADRQPNEKDFKELTSIIKKRGGISHTTELAVSFTDKAKKLLELFPESDTSKILSFLTDYVLSRKK